LTRRLHYLSTFATATVLLGGFGSLYRLHQELGAGGEPSTGIAPGVAASLAPTAYALLIAAVLVLGRGYLVSQSDSIIEQVHEFSARLINALIDRPDVRLGHR
jgi:biopolymer transport protein ExbB/TolQ